MVIICVKCMQTKSERRRVERMDEGEQTNKKYNTNCHVLVSIQKKFFFVFFILK